MTNFPNGRCSTRSARAAYIGAILNKVPSAAHGEPLRRDRPRKSPLRQLISASNGILRDAYSPHEKADIVLDHAEKRIFEIASKKVSGSISAMEDVLHEVFEMIEKKGQRGLESGFFELDDMTNGLQNGELVIVAGAAIHGESPAAGRQGADDRRLDHDGRVVHRRSTREHRRRAIRSGRGLSPGPAAGLPNPFCRRPQHRMLRRAFVAACITNELKSRRPNSSPRFFARSQVWVDLYTGEAPDRFDCQTRFSGGPDGRAEWRVDPDDARPSGPPLNRLGTLASSTATVVLDSQPATIRIEVLSVEPTRITETQCIAVSPSVASLHHR